MKVAVITGAASGIGLALTQIHLQYGDSVVMVDKDHHKLQKESEQLNLKFPDRVTAVSCDVTQANEVSDLAQHIMAQTGRVDWIYNNAGIIGQLAPLWELNPDHIRQVLDVNVHGMIHVIHAFSPFMFEQTFRSHIINMASLYALTSGSQTAAYAMSKHAVLALSESLYFDYMRLDKPVDVSVVFPSFTDTALLSHNSSYNPGFHTALQSLLAHSRPAIDIARHIVQEAEQKRFYIFPDKEVKGYCEDRTKAVIEQDNPHMSNIEKLMSELMRRSEKRRK